jgi:hypothetical protein
MTSVTLRPAVHTIYNEQQVGEDEISGAKNVALERGGSSVST